MQQRCKEGVRQSTGSMAVQSNSGQRDIDSNPATRKETVSDRVHRMFEKSNGYEEHEDSLSDIVSPTETTGMSKPGMFSPTHVQTLLRLFANMINGTPISKPVITQRLKDDSQGKEMVNNFTVVRVVNRLKYERKQKREKL